MEAILSALAGLLMIFTMALLSAARMDTGSALPQTVVGYSDLDLDDRAQARVLYERLAVAANAVCSTYFEHRPTSDTARRSCLERSLADAVHKVDRLQLTREYRSKLGATCRLLPRLSMCYDGLVAAVELAATDQGRR